MKKLFQKQVYIKPLPDGNWMVCKMSPIASFFNDWYLHGFEVALSNFQTEWTFALL